MVFDFPFNDNVIYPKFGKSCFVGGGVITFGSHTIYQHGNQYLPVVGWVTALGILGQQHWNHSFYGKISPIQILVKGGDQVIYYYEFIGALGFCGIKI